MFVDTSAFVALLADESDQGRIAAAMDAATNVSTSGIVRLETVMVLSRELNVAPSAAQFAFDELIEAAGIKVIGFTDEMGRIAVDAFEKFGKGRKSAAQLNLGDCLSYAAAKGAGLPLLFLGDDFTKTDVSSVLGDPAPATRKRR
jgi:ribonuclease VapC